MVIVLDTMPGSIGVVSTVMLVLLVKSTVEPLCIHVMLGVGTPIAAQVRTMSCTSSETFMSIGFTVNVITGPTREKEKVERESIGTHLLVSHD